jgi:hypothetical protein
MRLPVRQAHRHERLRHEDALMADMPNIVVRVEEKGLDELKNLLIHLGRERTRIEVIVNRFESLLRKAEKL